MIAQSRQAANRHRTKKREKAAKYVFYVVSFRYCYIDGIVKA